MLESSEWNVEVINTDLISKNRPALPDNALRVELPENARTVLEKRYLRKGEDGLPIETVEEMFWRVAYHIAEPESQWSGDVETRAKQFYDLLASKRFFPNSPTFTGAGTPLGQLAACFVLPISDDMGRDSAGIFQTLRDAALIQQTGGGNGFSFSNLRHKGSIVNTSAGFATGPVGFLRVYDKAFGEIAQGGTRRGANMAVLRVDHPDIRDFISCKVDENQITNFNISVGLTDEFMKAVKEGHMEEPWQYFAALLPVKSVGVQGDIRAYGFTIVVRAVESLDAMTANYSTIPHDVLERISLRITNSMGDKVNRVVYDITNKPPATIEWE